MLIIGHIGNLFILIFFYVAFFGYVWYHGLFVSCLGGVGVGLFLFFVIVFVLNCYVLGGELE